MPLLATPRQWIGRLLNICLLLTLCIFVGLLIKRHYSKSKPPIIGPSARIAISGVDLSKSPRTLVLAVAKDCKYCTDSARFYRRLIEDFATRNDIQIVVLFPESTAEGRWYLNTLGIAIEESHQAHLSSYGIKNVPTLALLDRNGVVNNVWVGKLPPKTESEVMQTLGMQDTRPTEDWLVNQHEIERRRNQGEKLIVVDLRDRNVYALNHLPNTMNIPLDELNARAKNELPQ